MSSDLPPQFQEVTPGNWKYDWQPYLQGVASSNSGATVSFSTSSVTGTTGGALVYYIGGVLAPNGKIYCVPYQSTAIGIIDPIASTYSTTTFPTGTITGTGAGTAAYAGGVLAPNGKIYFIPNSATVVGVVDPVANTYTTFGTAPGSSAYVGGVLAPNGKIYCVSQNATSIGIIDPTANTFSTTTFPTGTITGTGAASSAYTGGVLAPNGKIYFIPRNATTVGVVDPDANTYTTFGTAPGSGAYAGGVLAPNGKIYCVAYQATSIGIIDPTVNTFSTTTFPSGTVAAANSYYGGVLGPNGKIYFIPWGSSFVGVIDPVANTYTTFAASAAFIGGVLAPNGNIYCTSAGNNNIGRISFSSLSQTPSSNYCLSPYANKF